MTDLTDDDRLAISAVVHQNYYMPDVFAVVERIADDAARAAERALVERVKAAAESDHRFTGMNCACGHELNSPRGWLTHVLRTTALRPEAATTERRWDECLHGVTLGSVCLDCPSKWASIPARPAATTEGMVCVICRRPEQEHRDRNGHSFSPAAAVHPDTEGERA